MPLEAAGGWRRARLGMAMVVGGGITRRFVWPGWKAVLAVRMGAGLATDTCMMGGGSV